MSYDEMARNRVLNHVGRLLNDLQFGVSSHRPSIIGDGQAAGRVVVLCGSARFEKWFHVWNKSLTMAGNIVFSLTTYPSVEGDKVWYSESEKAAMDAAHRLKIEISDCIVVINRFGYIGESTLREIEYAKILGKSVYFWESWGEGCGYRSYGYEKEVYEAMNQYDIPESWFSPINTSNYPSVMNLLGSAGKLRSDTVNHIEQMKRDELYGEAKAEETTE